MDAPRSRRWSLRGSLPRGDRPPQEEASIASPIFGDFNGPIRA